MIYLDHAAATPASPKALEAMLPYFSTEFYNPSAPYLPAKHVREAYEAAKDQLAHVIGAKGVDLVMTSGATESINLAFTAAMPQSFAPHSIKNPCCGSVDSTAESGKILVLATEHAAVLEAAKPYPHELIPVDRQGMINLTDFRSQLSDDVVLVSISLANNELGTIQPLAEIAEILREVRQQRLQRGITLPLYLHSDASQALSLIDINVARLGVDLLTLNAAKCGGPKGIGALYVGHGIRLQPISRGGGQERGLRSGTENVPGMIGFAVAAVENHAHLAYHRKQYQEMAQILRRELAHTSIVAHIGENVKHKRNNSQANSPESAKFQIPEPIFLGNPKHQLASFVPVCFPGIDAERLIYKLEAKDVFVSTGAACAANKGTKSHVLAAIGLSDEEIAGSLRLSLGSTNTVAQIKKAAGIITSAVSAEYSRLLLSQNSSRPTGSERSEQAACDDRPAQMGFEKKTNANTPLYDGGDDV